MEKKVFIEISLRELRQIVREECHSALQLRKDSSSTNHNEAKQIMSIADACRYLDLSKSTIYKLTSQGAIPHRKPGKRLYFIKTELDAWVEKSKVNGQDDLRRELEQHLHKNGRNSASLENG